MALITSQLQKHRQEDRIQLRRGNRNCNTGGNNPLANVYVDPLKYNPPKDNPNTGGSQSQ